MFRGRFCFRYYLLTVGGPKHNRSWERDMFRQHERQSCRMHAKPLRNMLHGERLVCSSTCRREPATLCYTCCLMHDLKVTSGVSRYNPKSAPDSLATMSPRPFRLQHVLQKAGRWGMSSLLLWRCVCTCCRPAGAAQNEQMPGRAWWIRYANKGVLPRRNTAEHPRPGPVPQANAAYRTYNS